MHGSYGRMCRYRRIVEGLRLVLEDMSDQDGKAYQWVSDALRLMQEKLDMESEAYYAGRREEKQDDHYAKGCADI